MRGRRAGVERHASSSAVRCAVCLPRALSYLTEEQRRRIDELAAARGVTLAEVVRLALDEYLDSEVPDAGPILAATFGAAPELVPPDRGEWGRG